MNWTKAYEQMKLGKIVRRSYSFAHNGAYVMDYVYHKLEFGTFLQRANFSGWQDWEDTRLYQDDLDATDWEVVE